MRSKLLLVVALVFALVPLTGAMAWAGGPDDYSHAETYEFWNDCTSATTVPGLPMWVAGLWWI